MRTPVPPVHSLQRRHVPSSHHTISRTATQSPIHPPYGQPYHHVVPITHPHFAALGAFKQPFQPPAPNSGPGSASPPAPIPPRGHGQTQRPFGRIRRHPPVVPHLAHCNAGGAAALSRFHADSTTLGVTRGITLVTAVTGPPVETPVSWEYPTGVWALLPLSGRPVTPHCSMRQPGAGGRSTTSPIEPRVRGKYGSLSGRHDLSHRVGRHTPSAVATHPGQEDTASHEPPPLSCRVKKRWQAHQHVPHLVKLHYPWLP